MSWQYANRGARFTWSLNAARLNLLNIPDRAFPEIFRRGFHQGPHPQKLYFEHVDDYPLTSPYIQGVPYNHQIYTVPPQWMEFEDLNLLNLILNQNGSTNLTDKPVIIPFPMEMVMTPDKSVGDKPKNFKNKFDGTGH